MKRFRLDSANPSATALLPEILGDANIVSGGLYVFKPGETAHPESHHTHDVDEVFLFVQGTGVLPIDGVDYPIETGDLIVVEAGEDHHTRSSDENPLVAAWWLMDRAALSTAESVEVHWYEQSAYSVRGPSGEILVDPYFPVQRPAERYIRPTPPVDPATLSPTLVLLTHDHSDHTHPETVAAIAAASPETTFVGPSEAIERILSESSVPKERTIVLAAGDSTSVTSPSGGGGITVTAFYSKHPNGDSKADIAAPDTQHFGYVADIDGHRLLFTGDPINTIADIPELIAPVRALRPHTGFITTHPTEGEFPYFAGARKFAESVGLSRAVPAHYDCFAKRTYDPQEFAAEFEGSSVEVTIIPWNSSTRLAARG